MFKSDTLFIVGAGASHEAGLPLGVDLTKAIAKLLDFETDHFQIKSGDHQIYEVLRQLANSPSWPQNSFLGSGRAIAEAMELAPSIDTFLETHRANREYVLLGKLAIAKAIAQAERASLIASSGEYDEIPFNMSRLADSWYPLLAQQMFTGVDADEPENAFDNVSFVIFNYDRCLQTYLHRAVRTFFRVSGAVATDMLQKATFLHPYGSLGSITEPESAPFGASSLDICKAAEAIRTYSESSDITQRIRERVFACETLVFLGFAFHPANLELLSPDQKLGVNDNLGKRVYATTYGLSASDEGVVKGQLADMLFEAAHTPPAWFFPHNGTCSDLFRNYWRSLTA